MSHRLGKKLDRASAPGSGASAAAPKTVRKACFVREQVNPAMCTYQTAEGVTWVFPAAHLVTVRSTDDGGTMQIFYTGAEIHVEGSRLTRIRGAIARGQAFLVRAVNPSFKSEYEDEVFVSLIRVIETKPSKAVRDGAAAP